MLSGLILASVLITDPLDAAAHEPYRLFRVSFRYYLGVARNVSVVQDNSEGSSRTPEAHHLAQVFGTQLCRGVKSNALLIASRMGVKGVRRYGRTNVNFAMLPSITGGSLPPGMANFGSNRPNNTTNPIAAIAIAFLRLLSVMLEECRPAHSEETGNLQDCVRFAVWCNTCLQWRSSDSRAWWRSWSSSADMRSED